MSNSGRRQRPHTEITPQSDRVKLAAIYAFAIESYRRRKAAEVADGEINDNGTDGSGRTGSISDEGVES
jgi:hypothetical protein